MEVTMKKSFQFAIYVAGLIGLVILLAALSGACKAKKSETSEEPSGTAEIIGLDQLKPVLGEAREDNSGVVDVSGDSNNLIISYRYFNPDLKNYDDGLVKDLAPKIEALFKQFKNLKRVQFQVAVNDPQVPGKWKAYVDFAVHKKLIEKMEWSNILTDDFFRNVIDLKRYD
jgi:hypothetical protein